MKYVKIESMKKTKNLRYEKINNELYEICKNVMCEKMQKLNVGKM